MVRRIRGQVAVASTPGTVQRIAIDPADAPACPEAVAAIREADVVTLGPGSWMTSVLPHLLLPELGGRARSATAATRVVVLNLVPQPGETDDFSQEQYLTVSAPVCAGFPHRRRRGPHWCGCLCRSG